MKKLNFLIVMIFCAFVSNAQNLDSRIVPAFTEVNLKIEAQLHLLQDDEQTLQIKAEKASTLKKLITEVKDRKLIIRYTNSDRFLKNWNPGKLDIYITMPDVEMLEVAGSGSIICDEDIVSRIIDLKLNGSGDIKLVNLDAEKLVVNISGSGSIALEGVEKPIKEVTANLSGSGDFWGIDAPLEKVNVKIGGSGTFETNCDGDIIAKIMGSGNVVYTGNPNVESQTVGSGRVKKK